MTTLKRWLLLDEPSLACVLAPIVHSQWFLSFVHIWQLYKHLKGRYYFFLDQRAFKPDKGCEGWSQREGPAAKGNVDPSYINFKKIYLGRPKYNYSYINFRNYLLGRFTVILHILWRLYWFLANWHLIENIKLKRWEQM